MPSRSFLIRATSRSNPSKASRISSTSPATSSQCSVYNASSSFFAFRDPALSGQSAGSGSLWKSCFRTASSVSLVTFAPPYVSRMSQFFDAGSQPKPSTYSSCAAVASLSYLSQASRPSRTKRAISSSSSNGFSTAFGPLIGASSMRSSGTGAPDSSVSTSSTRGAVRSTSTSSRPNIVCVGGRRWSRGSAAALVRRRAGGQRRAATRFVQGRVAATPRRPRRLVRGLVRGARRRLPPARGLLRPPTQAPQRLNALGSDDALAAAPEAREPADPQALSHQKKCL
mmetsp:Transcript_31088/g.93188  ORF Transcript_31088/g.93188 Transcript_31088/m.93188 type:complete len:284 (+) Transcript_31088:574-1425(+)